ncbi:MAG TPA: hypothetical protein VFB14_17395 [Bryobacteraceae bacterium]|jgi:TolB-like protein/Tfp pilus assembly protein PilF|nr:hypothetical protein [Bryobacteraceae bacterium]
MPQPTVNSRTVELELARVLQSREFQDSGRMCRFLRFTVEATLAGKADELKEYSIAVAVFDREPDFDPRTDPVVRSEARRLRSKLASYYANEGVHDELVIEVPKGGYVPQFRERSAPTDLPRSQKSTKSYRAYKIAAVLAALALTLAGLFLLHARWNGMRSEPVRSVAVLPFQNMTGDRQMDYLADGISDEVLNSLAFLADLKVVARTSAAQFKGRNVGVQEIGRRLGVKTLLEGSVRTSADKLRVMTRLVDAETGYQLWSQSYEFQTKDLFEVQDAIAQAVAEQLGQEANMPIRRLSAVNEEAYKDYLLGRHYIAEANGNEALLREAKRLLEQAVALDPKNADAWATLAWAHGTLTMTGILPLSEGLQTTLQYGQKALELDPNSADALSEEAIGTAVMYHDWKQADGLFRRAIAIKPSDALTRETYAWSVLWPTGRLEEAQQEQKKAIELDPLNAEWRVGLSLTLYFQHQYEAAIRVGKEALVLNPSLQHVADNLLRPLVITGRVEEISALMQRFWKEEPDHSFALCMKAFAAGDQTTARQEAKRALQRDKDFVHRALLYAVLDEEGQIISTFEHATLREGMWAIDAAVLDPAFDRYRSSPRFQQIMKKVVAAR